MSFSRRLVIAILAAMSFAVSAQEKSLLMDPADPHAAESSYLYESAFADYRSMPEDEVSAETWHAANQEMGQLGGHAGHIKGKLEIQSASPAESGSGSSSAPQAPKFTPADHSRHGMRHQHQGQ